MMTSQVLGKHTLQTEVTHVSSHGLWLLASGQEYFLSFEDFPWFRDAPIGQVVHVEAPSPGHFHWPDLDVDLSENIILHPDQYPLKSH